ncbi:MAG: flagellar hook-associated protein FlgK [Dehalococcoidia bacterium]
MGLSVALNTAMRALLAQQQAMDAVSHNVSNVNTPGYSRQRVLLSPVAAPAGSGVGGGVSFDGVQRVRDMFVDFQMRQQKQTAGEAQTRADSLHLAELAFSEPSDSGLRSVMSQFFNSWRDLSNTPEDGSARSAVVQAGQTFAITAQRLQQGLTDLRDSADSRLQDSVAEMNNLASQIAVLNQKITSIRASGDPGGDLSDQRDLALDRLSELANVTYNEQTNGSVDVVLNGRSLVHGVSAYAIALVPNAANNNYSDLTWAGDGATVTVASGEIGGLLTQRDTDLTSRLVDLNTLVAQIITDVNAAHAAGYALDGTTTGTDFFSGTDAADIDVDAAVAANPGLLAAATNASAVGDGSNALAVAALQTANTLSSGSETYDSFYGGLVSRIGVAAKDAQSLADAQALTVSHLEELRQSVAGVNVDEEMVNLVQYQRGYEAAARIIRAVDEMLDTLINRT